MIDQLANFPFQDWLPVLVLRTWNYVARSAMVVDAFYSISISVSIDAQRTQVIGSALKP